MYWNLAVWCLAENALHIEGFTNLHVKVRDYIGLIHTASYFFQDTRGLVRHGLLLTKSRCVNANRLLPASLIRWWSLSSRPSRLQSTDVRFTVLYLLSLCLEPAVCIVITSAIFRSVGISSSLRDARYSPVADFSSIFAKGRRIIWWLQSGPANPFPFSSLKKCSISLS